MVAYQPVGDLLRFNSHWHALILEGGFDAEGQFVETHRMLSPAGHRAVSS